jgi:hypothetical protein
VTATGAEAGSNLVPAGPVVTTAADDARPTDPASAERATGAPVGEVTSRSPRLMVRGIIAGILAVLAGGGAWLLLRHGVRTDAFPPFLTDTDATPITRYSGPWITAAAGAALLAALLLLSAVLDLIRWSRTAPRDAG